MRYGTAEMFSTENLTDSDLGGHVDNLENALKTTKSSRVRNSAREKHRRSGLTQFHKFAGRPTSL